MPTPGSPEALLHRHFGFSAFRPAQGAIVRSVMAGRDTLAILPTGGGKSVCFQVPAVALGGVTLVVSPLISLMQDQVSAAVARGIAARHLSGEQARGSVGEAVEQARLGRLSLLYVSPERLPAVAQALARAGCMPTRLAVDEAHCISEWGHDFRPAFRRIGAALAVTGAPPVVALTGSATPAVRDDIARTLGLGGPGRTFDLHVASFDRPNLRYGVLPVRSSGERFERLRRLCRAEPGLAIVYAPTRRATETLAVALRHAGRPAVAYHAGLPREVRAARLAAFLGGTAPTIVATSAFGMGIDKPDVRLVVHWAMPPTPESYYQEAGRAGRDGAVARCILLHGPGDAELHHRQLDVTFPPRRLLERIWRGERTAAPAAVLESARRLRAELTSGTWEAIARRRRMAERRIAAMAGYATTRRCRRRALIGWFGEELPACSGCDRCGGEGIFR